MFFDVKEKVENKPNDLNVIKTADNDAVIEPIKNRWSIRAFSEEKITDETMAVLFEAARWAPSSMNEQPWRFVYAHRGSRQFEVIADTLSLKNKIWAENAAVLMAVFAEKNFRVSGRPNPYALHDTGAATYGLMLQAQAMGIYGHIMGGYDRHGLKNALKISEEFEPVTVVALGYQGSPDQLDEDLRVREYQPRKRKSLEEFAVKIG